MLSSAVQQSKSAVHIHISTHFECPSHLGHHKALISVPWAICTCSVTQLCPTLWDPLDCGSPGSSVHGIIWARILEGVAIFSSRVSSWLREGTCANHSSCIAGWFFTIEPPGKPPLSYTVGSHYLSILYTVQCIYVNPNLPVHGGMNWVLLGQRTWCRYFTLSFALPLAPVSPSHTLHLAPSPVAHRGCLSVGPTWPGGEKKWHFLLVWFSLYLRQALCSWTGPGVGGHHSQWSWPLPTASLACMLSHFSCVRLCVTLWTLARQVPLSMGLSRQEYWSGLPFPSPWDLPNPGIEPVSLMPLALAGRFFTTSATWEDHSTRKCLMACVLPSTLPTGVYSFFLLHFPSQSQSSRVLWEGFTVLPQGHRLLFLGEEDAGEAWCLSYQGAAFSSRPAPPRETSSSLLPWPSSFSWVLGGGPQRRAGR